jgi:hypothetical protein
MNANRKADLQRKLALAPVPKPPAGLAERIKTEIPKELRFNAERERERFSRSVRFSMSVAASVIVVVSAAYVVLTMMSKEPATIAPAHVRAIQAPKAMPAAPPVAQERVDEERGDRELKQKKPVKLAAARKKEKNQPPVSVAEQVNAMSKVATAAEAPAVQAPAAAARTMAMDRTETVPVEMTTSPISGKAMVRAGTNVYDAPPKTNLNLIPWKDASRETKLEILKTELARGADPQAVSRVARDAGLNEFADSIEKH